MRAPFTLQGTQPGIVAEFYLALTRADEPPPPPPVHTADPPAHPHDAHRPEPIHHPSSQEEGSGSSDVSFDVSFAPGGDLQLDPAGCELDAEMAVQLKAGEMEAQGQAVQAVQAQAQADTEEGGRGGSAHTLWRTFTLSQPGPPLDHLEALVRGARCAVVTCSPVASSDTSPRCVPPPPPPRRAAPPAHRNPFAHSDHVLHGYGRRSCWVSSASTRTSALLYAIWLHAKAGPTPHAPAHVSAKLPQVSLPVGLRVGSALPQPHAPTPPPP